MSSVTTYLRQTAASAVKQTSDRFSDGPDRLNAVQSEQNLRCAF